MRSERAADAGGLSLAELLAQKPRLLRGRLPPGARIPGGARTGTRRAQGAEFDGLSPYQPGDEIRQIDWRATARTGKLQSKRFVADAHRARMIVLDDGPQMVFGTRGLLMAKTAALGAAFLIWEAVTLHEAVGLTLTSGGAPVRPRRGAAAAMALLERIVAAYAAQTAPGAPTGAGHPADRVNAAAESLRRGDEICVISDFGSLDSRLTEVSRTLAGLRDLRAFVVDDAALRTGLAPGRYPVLASDNLPAGPSLRTGPGEQCRIADAQMREREDGLRRLGWNVFPAAALILNPPDGLT